MTTLLPKDADNNIIPALRLRDNAAHALSVGASSVRNSVAFDTDTKVVSLYASVPVFIRFGDDTVDATTADHYFPAGVYYDIALSGGAGKGPHNAYIAAISAEEDGVLYISEKE
ncbi:MAG TPA: hypothetical protein PLF01_00970 [Alphaproteobacteria bacterium]|nr:hypothetical protein [Alphaproteobacteria bacterium]